MDFKIEECKRGDWQVKENIVLDIGTFYLLTDAENSVELAAFAYKVLELAVADARLLFGDSFLGVSRPLFGYEPVELLGYSPSIGTMDAETLDRVWTFMRKLQRTHEEKGDAFWWQDKFASRIYKDMKDLKRAQRVALGEGVK